MNGIEYSICSVNLNMADTIEASVRSIMNQVDESYEMIIVDGGSSDSSVSIIRDLKNDYSNLKLVISEKGGLGHDRNVSIEHAMGDYVILQIDTDDFYYDGVIPAFVDFFHEIEDDFDSEILASGHEIHMAPKSLFENYRYKDINRGEDRELWNRLLNDGKFVKVETPKVKKSLASDGLFEKADKILTGIYESLRRGHGLRWDRVKKKMENAPRVSFDWRREK